MNTPGYFGNTRLHLAVERHDLEMIERLVILGADLQARNRSGSTPLRLAIKKGYAQIVDLLVDMGADVNEMECETSPLHEAVYYWELYGRHPSDILCTLLLNSFIDPVEAACASAAIGDVEMLKTFLEEKGVDPKAKDRGGYSPLASAVAYLNFECIKYLLETYDLDVEEEITLYDITGYYTEPIILMANYRKDSGEWAKQLSYMARKSKRPQYWLSYLDDWI